MSKKRKDLSEWAKKNGLAPRTYTRSESNNIPKVNERQASQLEKLRANIAKRGSK